MMRGIASACAATALFSILEPTSIAHAQVANNNTGLQAIPSTQYQAIIRLGVNTPGDGGRAKYVSSNLPCSLNAGNGDGQSQVKSADGHCWLKDPIDDWLKHLPLYIKNYGVKCDGLTDDGAQINTLLATGRHVIFPAGTCLTSVPLQITVHTTGIEGESLGATIIKPIAAMSSVIDWGGTGLVMGAIKNVNITNQSNLATSCIHYHPSGARSGNNFSVIEDVVLISCNDQGILMDAAFPGGDALMIQRVYTNATPIAVNIANQGMNSSITDSYFFNGRIVLNVTPATSGTGNTHASTTIDHLNFSTSALFVGESVSGFGIPPEATVTSITGGSSIAISSATASSLAGTKLTFGQHQPEGVRIANNTILPLSNGPGIQILAGLEISIERNVIDQARGPSSCIAMDTANWAISSIKITDNWCGASPEIYKNIDGIKMIGQPEFINILGNTVVGWSGFAINISRAQNVVISNTKAYFNVGGDVQLTNTIRARLVDNAFLSSVNFIEAGTSGTIANNNYFAGSVVPAAGSSFCGNIKYSGSRCLFPNVIVNSGMPTNCTGQLPGTLWNSGGVVHVC
jgi:hypothetical protein